MVVAGRTGVAVAVHGFIDIAVGVVVLLRRVGIGIGGLGEAIVEIVVLQRVRLPGATVWVGLSAGS